jgi:hypothetical protein
VALPAPLLEELIIRAATTLMIATGATTLLRIFPPRIVAVAAEGLLLLPCRAPIRSMMMAPRSCSAAAASASITAEWGRPANGESARAAARSRRPLERIVCVPGSSLVAARSRDITAASTSDVAFRRHQCHDE